MTNRTVQEWFNADGLPVKFPGYYTDPKNFINVARAVNSFGPTRQLVYFYDLTLVNAGGIAGVAFTTDRSGDGVVDGFSNEDIYIPAGSAVTTARHIVFTPAAGGTSVKLDLFELDGSNTTLTNHSMFTTSVGATASLTPRGTIILPDGVIPGNSANYAAADSIPQVDAFLAITTAGTFTAGTGLFIIDYVPTQLDVSTTLIGG